MLTIERNRKMHGFSHHIYIWFLITIVGVVNYAPSFAQERVWTSTSGKHTVTATYIEHDDQIVRLRKQNGEEISVPIKQLSEQGQTFLARIKSALSDSRSKWLKPAEEAFFETFPASYQIGKVKYVRYPALGKLKDVAKTAEPKLKNQIMNVIASNEISKNSKRGQQIAKLYRHGEEQLRYRLIESLLVNEEPLSAAYRITQSIGRSGILSAAWSSKKQRYRAMLESVKIAQASVTSILGDIQETHATLERPRISAKLMAGNESVQLVVRSAAELYTPIIQLEAQKKQTENWARINGLGALFGQLTGLTNAEDTQQAVELADAQQEFWNQKLMIVLMLDHLPADKNCTIDLPVLNFKLHQLESLKCNITTDKGALQLDVPLKKTKAGIDKKRKSGERYARNVLEQQYSPRPGSEPKYNGIYPGAIWQGTFRGTGNQEIEVPKNVRLLIQSVDAEKFVGRLYKDLTTIKVAGQVNERKKLTVSARIDGYKADDFEGRLGKNTISLKREYDQSSKISKSYYERAVTKTGKTHQFLNLKFLKPRKSNVSKVVVLSGAKAVTKNDNRVSSPTTQTEKLEFRTWVATNTWVGVQDIPKPFEAAFHKTGGFGTVQLRKRSGEVIRIPLSALSTKDQTYLRNRYKVQ